ncbi:MAG TPA: DUF3099 domain-containing protein [Streptosporangiaceae bacterium]
MTEARPSLADDIAYRQRRYLIMMGIRAVCFIVAVVFFVNHLGWLTAIPIVGAIAIPYFAVIFANAGREPVVHRGFIPYEPNLPVRRQPGDGDTPGGSPGMPGETGPNSRDPGSTGGNGAPSQNA